MGTWNAQVNADAARLTNVQAFKNRITQTSDRTNGKTQLDSLTPRGGWMLSSKRRDVRFPPGPRRIPIFGNLFQLLFEVDFSQSWLTFSKWKQTYGPLIYLDVVGQSVLILNSRKVAKDLLDDRAAKYSDRPSNLVGTEYVTGNMSIAVMHYSEL
ncbi:hypothetical protein D9758_002855 [Tetrapyrgos nigripes]|uniref:Cytochrome P450 n=1 Tax=Tetrapyrgos nigripes TaxID=182062 RepID=A0A8H5GQE7_9AGAR|nr:hypothetical protein D9758_002855 [Tetrapyrgos nigripes]